MIEVTGLSKKYGTHLAVSNVSFNIEKGEVVGFLGPNGAGKSTIMNILTGYISLSEGKVTIDGYDITDAPEQAKKRIGYLPEIPPLYLDMTVREYLYFLYDLKKVSFPKAPHIDEIIRLVRIEEVAGRLIKNLSKGFRQRVGIAGALVGNPDVLILDEPTVGLDPKQIIEIRELIAKLGKNHTVILSSHILSEIQEVCKRVIIINRGKLVADGTYEELSNKLSQDRTVVVRATGTAQEVLSAIQSVKGVKDVKSLGSMEYGSNDYQIEPEENADIRREVCERLFEKKKGVLGISTNKLSLEQIFLRLTENSDMAVEEFQDQSLEETALEEEAEITVEEISNGEEEQ